MLWSNDCNIRHLSSWSARRCPHPKVSLHGGKEGKGNHEHCVILTLAGRAFLPIAAYFPSIRTAAHPTVP
jgi:hypothetical protein